MVVSIGSNISSLRAQRQLGRASESLSASLTRLSSGQRINRASDDAAGLAISSTLSASSRVYNQGVRNVNDAISYLNVAEGATQQFSSVLQRLKELATSAANGTLGLTQRKSLDREAFELQKEFNRLVQGTRFNGLNVLDGSVQRLVAQAGFGTNGMLQFNVTESLSRAVGTGEATSVTNLGNGANGNDMVTADFNGDGKVDLFSARYIYLGNGDGTFGAASILTDFSIGDTVMAGDVNGDGKVDLLGSTGTSVEVFLGNGNGTFSTGQTLSGSFLGAELKDLNGDGKLDIIGRTGNSVITSLGNGDGTFRTAATYATGGAGISNMTFGDFNGDGIVDAAAIATTTLRILYGNGSGAFSLANTQTVASGSRLGAADFNHDGIDDVIIGGGVNSSIYLNQGGGSFTLSQTISGFSTFTDRFKFADINQDGEIDIVASSGGGPKVVLGSSSGVFGSVISQTALTSGLALGDFNGDGVPDFATGDDSSGGIDIGISNTTQSTLLSRINLLSRQNALDSLSIIDAALARVNKQNGAVGAHLSRLEIAMANLGASSLNFDSARSRIVDADVASESAQLVRSTILQQAASSVLAQANQAPALALVLLRS